jgi:beta-galactosidase
MKIIFSQFALFFTLSLFISSGEVFAQQMVTFACKDDQLLTFHRLTAIPEGANKQSLTGKWEFTPDRTIGKKSEIEVPGEWVMQGFKVKPDTYAEYSRSFSIPSDWKGKRIKLHFNAVYSETEVFINGSRLGYHLGGFTQFEFDITDIVKTGSPNRLSLLVKSESVTDSLASASQYAVHQLGGINRDVYLFATPEINIAYFHVATLLDYMNNKAGLETDVIIANESTSTPENMEVLLELFDQNNTKLITSKKFSVSDLPGPGKIVQQQFKMELDSPNKWDAEHPYLYQLKMSIQTKGSSKSSYNKRIGFRKIEVIGNQLFVNGNPVKLKGVCRHEVMPLRGRSLAFGQWAKDVAIFRDGNVNYIRTSHYPPDQKLAEAADSLGMFLEVEAPFCWAHVTRTIPENQWQDALVMQHLDMVNTFKSNPSVIIWSLANESQKYQEYFSKTAKLVKQFDPIRPRNFSYLDEAESDLEITNVHYPGPGGPDKYRNTKRPIVFDEYCHLNAYNRRELYTDPSLRDMWGIGFAQMWENMYHSKGVLGGAIWAAIDDSFFISDSSTVGYGTWGPIDGWRRPKPEFWHMKKVYSPVRIELIEHDKTKGILCLYVENRFYFTDLSECRFEWTNGDKRGNLIVKGKPSTIDTVNIPVGGIGKGPVDVEVFDPRGVMCDKYSFNFETEIITKDLEPIPVNYEEKAGYLHVKQGDIEIIIRQNTGSILSINSKGEILCLGDALLMIQNNNNEGSNQMTGIDTRWTPLNEACSGRKIVAINIEKGKNTFSLFIRDEYNETFGYTEYFLNEYGNLEVSYCYTVKKDFNPHQWGLVFSLPSGYTRLFWSRFGQWNYYPKDHIGRLNGEAPAHNSTDYVRLAGPNKVPGYDWKDDQNELGTNDFRSTKVNIISAGLSNGKQQLTVLGGTNQSVRAWTEKNVIKFLVAGYNGLGSERFFRSHAVKYDKPLKTGDKICDKILLNLISTK